MGRFMYNVNTLIRLVKNRRILWDKTTEQYKSRKLRRKAWLEIFTHFEPHYNKLDVKHQKQISDCIVEKWGNLRISLNRSIKIKNGQHVQKRPYIYHKSLLFLLEPADSRMCNTEYNTEENNHKYQQATDNKRVDDKDEDAVYSEAKNENTSNVSSRLDSEVNELLIEKEENDRNEDECFFIFSTSTHK